MRVSATMVLMVVLTSATGHGGSPDFAELELVAGGKANGRRAVAVGGVPGGSGAGLGTPMFMAVRSPAHIGRWFSMASRLDCSSSPRNMENNSRRQLRWPPGGGSLPAEKRWRDAQQILIADPPPGSRHQEQEGTARFQRGSPRLHSRFSPVSVAMSSCCALPEPIIDPGKGFFMEQGWQSHGAPQPFLRISMVNWL